MKTTVSTKQLNTLEQLCQFKQKTVLKVMDNYLKQKYNKVETTKDYIIAYGNIPVALVAHADTVFSQTPTNIYYDARKNIMISPQGLGADDRAGVYCIIEILKTTEFRPTVIITTDEERGAIGAMALTVAHLKSPIHLNYIIQLDRRGEKDCVFYDCENEEFEKYINSFGFETAYGTFSDISVICPAWKIAGVNLSVGYFHEHTAGEILNLNFMFDTIEKVKNMLADATNSKFYEYIEKIYANDYEWYKGYHQYGKSFSGDIKVRCNCCLKTYKIDDLYPVQTSTGVDYYCIDCLSSDKLGWCVVCNDPYVIRGEDHALCEDCRKEYNIYDDDQTKVI